MLECVNGVRAWACRAPLSASIFCMPVLKVLCICLFDHAGGVFILMEDDDGG